MGAAACAACSRSTPASPQFPLQLPPNHPFKPPLPVPDPLPQAVTKDGELRLTIPKTQVEQPQAKSIPVDTE